MRDVIFSRVLAVALVVVVSPVAAQPVKCDACVRGDAIINKLSLQAVRSRAGELTALSLTEPLPPEQYARVIELRRQAPELVRLGAVDDADLALVAAALCHASNDACTTATTRALRCLADRCAVALPEPEPKAADVVTERCGRYIARKRSLPFGLGFDWGNGWHRSRYPNDGRAWSFGIETRLRLSGKLGAVARVDRVAGRDEATEVDGNGRDSISTGSITRISALAGPSFILDLAQYERTTRFVRLDLLGGYLATRSQEDENGPAAGFDLGFQLWNFRTGVRFVQAFGDAREATTVLAHLGFVVGSAPEYDYAAGCGGDPPVARSSRLAVGFDIPLGGYGISKQLGALATGLAVEAKWHVTRRFDAVTRADLLLFPGDERDRVIHQAVLGGLRLDHGRDTDRSSRIGWFTTVLGGYSHGAGLTPTTTGTGPVVDLSLGWGGQGYEGAAWFQLHGRFGVAPDNLDYRVVFISAGFELRLDPRRWHDRV